MLNQIQNSKREILIKHSIVFISNAIKKIAVYNKNYILVSTDEIFHHYKFQISPDFDIKTMLFIKLDRIHHEKSKIQIEIQQVATTENQILSEIPVDMQISNIIEVINYLLANPDAVKFSDSIVSDHSEYKLGKVALLALFFGLLGVHRLYTKNYFYGIILLTTLGGFTILWSIDLILLGLNIYRDGKGKKLQQTF